MDLKTEIPTAYGNVPLEQVLRAFEKSKEWAANKKAWSKTEEGKIYNRQKSKDYYNRHKAQVLAKRAERYEVDKETLINRGKEYYKKHSEELIEKNRQRRQKAREESKKTEKTEV